MPTPNERVDTLCVVDKGHVAFVYHFDTPYDAREFCRRKDQEKPQDAPHSVITLVELRPGETIVALDDEKTMDKMLHAVWMALGSARPLNTSVVVNIARAVLAALKEGT